MGRGAWRVTVHGAAKSPEGLKRQSTSSTVTGAGDRNANTGDKSSSPGVGKCYAGLCEAPHRYAKSFWTDICNSEVTTLADLEITEMVSFLQKSV